MYTWKDSVFAIIMLICGFLYCNLITVIHLGFGVTLFAVIFCIAAVIYLTRSGFHQTRGSLLYLCIVILSAINFSIYDNFIIKGFLFLFLSVSTVYWICITTGRRLENKISIYLIGDIINQLLIVPFYNFTCCFGSIRSLFQKSQKGKGLLGGLVGILFILPVLILVISLLIDADAAFENLMKHLQFSLSERLLTYLAQLILGIPVACYLYGLIFGNRYGRNGGAVTLDSVNKNAAAMKLVPGVTVYSALTVLNLIYAVFFLSQLSYLFSAFRNSLPESMTYAEYARRGFFELCAVSGINLAVIAVAHGITKRDKEKILRIETAVLCIFTILLIVTAAGKMGMYIRYYGLTQLRVYTTWFMILLLVIFLILLARQFKMFNGTRVIVISFLVLFLGLCYSNADAVIAKYNIDRYRDGSLESVDVEALSMLSDAAVPYLYELYHDTGDQKLKAELKASILEEGNWKANRSMETFRDWNLQSSRADRIRERI